jgi:hypothetical protein
MKLSIIIPDLNLQDFKLFSQFIDRYIALGILIKCWYITQRAQMSLSVQLDKKEIQQLDSMRISAQTIQNNTYIVDLHYTQAVVNTAFYNLAEFKDLSETKDRSVFITEKIEEVISAPRSKLLNPNQINNETLPIHRKGLVAKYVGVTQSTPIYSPKDIIKQVNPLYINFPNLYECASNICSLCGLNLEQEISDVYKDIFQMENNLPSVEAAQKLLDFLLFKDNEVGKTIFTDGIGVGTENNLLPIEESFSIERSLPSAPLEIPIINPQDEVLLWMQNKALTSNSKLPKGKTTKPNKTNSSSNNTTPDKKVTNTKRGRKGKKE